MTNYASHYNFMDLLRDKGVSPLEGEQSNPFVAFLADIVEQASVQLKGEFVLPDEAHDFMDLLHDKGVVPAPCNDNDLTLAVA